MKKITNVLIFCASSPISGWTGQGISQTIENIIRYSDGIKYTLVIGKHVFQEVSIALAEQIKQKTLTLVTIGAYDRKLTFVDSKICKNLVLRSYELLLIIFVIKSIITRLIRPRYDLAWMPTISHIPAKFLCAKNVASFWDPFVFEYSGFDLASKFFTYNILDKNLKDSNAIVTQSQANKKYLIEIMNINEEKISVIENGNPNYQPHVKNKRITVNNILDFWNDTITKSDVNKPGLIGWIANTARKPNVDVILAKLNQSTLYRLVEKDSYRDSKIIIISTQDRPYKGFASLFETLNILVRDYSRNKFKFKFVFTGAVQKSYFDKYPWAQSLVYEFNKLTNQQHAYIYAISNLTIHPSFTEGGLGTYPMFESASLNISTLCNVGRHMIELEKNSGKSLEPLCIDLTNPNKSAEEIFKMITIKKLRTDCIKVINSIQNTWQSAGHKYSKFFKGIAS
jgi:hypothetical protein